MKKAKHYLIALLSGVLVATTVLSGCGQSEKAVSENDDHLTVYLWENRLMKNIVPYIYEQFPDQDICFSNRSFLRYSDRLTDKQAAPWSNKSSSTSVRRNPIKCL